MQLGSQGAVIPMQSHAAGPGKFDFLLLKRSETGLSFIQFLRKI